MQLLAILPVLMPSNSIAEKRLAARPILRSMPGPWGKAIERLRLAKGWTKEKAAEHSKMTPTSFGRLEKGRHTWTSKLQKIAEAFDVSIEEVLLLPAGERQASEIDQLIDRKVRQGVAEEVVRFRREWQSHQIQTRSAKTEERSKAQQQPAFTKTMQADLDDFKAKEMKNTKKKPKRSPQQPPTHRRKANNG